MVREGRPRFHDRPGGRGLYRRLARRVSGGGGIRTHGRLSPTTVFKTVDESATTPSPVRRSRRTNDRPSLPLPYAPSELPPDLAAVIDAWPDLPEPIRAGILAMI